MMISEVSDGKAEVHARVQTRELAKTKAERDILKKAIAYFAKEPR